MTYAEANALKTMMQRDFAWKVRCEDWRVSDPDRLPQELYAELNKVNTKKATR